MEAGNAYVKMRNAITDFHEVMLPPPDDYEVEELCVQDVAEDPGFALFLEALAGENECTTTANDAPPSTVQHRVSQPSNNISNENQAFELVSKGQSATEVPDHSIAGDTAVLSALPKAEEIKKERQREKNKRTQKAYRERQKERRFALEAEIASVKQKLEDTRSTWRQLRGHRSSLQQRLAAAQQDTPTPDSPTHSQNASRDRDSQECAVSGAHASDSKHQRISLQTLHSGGSQVLPKALPRTQFTSYFSPFSGQDRGYINEGLSKEVSPPIASFARCEKISFADISAFLAPNEAPTQIYKYNAIAHAVAAYQQSVSARTGVAIADICWFQQWSFPGIEPQLSFTASASSPECSLCATVCFLLGALESMFLVVEHDTLLEATIPSYVPPEYPGLDASAPPPTPPSPPDPEILQRAYLRCGVRQTQPLKEAVDRTLKVLLAKYRENLSHERWSAVCMQTMRITQAIVDALGPPTDTPKAYPGGSYITDGSPEHIDDSRPISGRSACPSEPNTADTTTASSRKGMRWEDLSAAVLATNQHLLCRLHEALNDPKFSDSMAIDTRGRSLTQVEHRMFELVGTSHMCLTVFLQASPITARRMIVMQFLGQSQNLLRASRQSMKLYKQMQLLPDQRACMADRWKSWCRRRAALGLRLAAALARFEGACPHQAALPRALMQHATLVATAAHPETPEDTSNRHAPHNNAEGYPWNAASQPHLHGQHAYQRSSASNHDTLPASKATSGGFSGGAWSENSKSMPPYTSDDACMHGAINDCPIQQNFRQIAGALESSDTESRAEEPSNAPGACVGPCATVLTCMHPKVPDCQKLTSSSGSGHQGEQHGSSDACASSQTADMHEQSSVPLWTRCVSEDNMSKQGCSNCHREFKNLAVLARSHESSGTVPAPALDETQHMHAPHASPASADLIDLGSMHDAVGSTAPNGEAHECQECILCSSQVRGSDREDGTGAANSGTHGKYSTWAPCIACGAGERALMLGESGEVAQEVYDALGCFLDVHTSDALMHFEFIGPFWELTEKQQALLMAAAVHLGQPQADMTSLWQTAAEEERREELFGQLSSLFI